MVFEDGWLSSAAEDERYLCYTVMPIISVIFVLAIFQCIQDFEDIDMAVTNSHTKTN